MNMVLEDVTEYEYTANGRKEVSSILAQLPLISSHAFTTFVSDIAGANTTQRGEYLYDGAWRKSVELGV